MTTMTTMTGLERFRLALHLLGAAVVVGVAIAAVAPFVFCSPSGPYEPASGCCLIVLPRATVDAVLLVLGGLIGSACVSCFLWIAYRDELFGAAETARYYEAIRDGDAKAGLGSGKN